MPLEAYLAGLNDGEWDGLAARWDDPAGLDRLRDAVSSWQDYEEQPLQAVSADGTIAIRTHFAGTTADGVRVELEPLTVLSVDGERITGVQSWHGAAVPAVDLVGEYFRASNEEDWDAFGRVWADDAELVAVGGPPRHGRESVVRAYRLFLGLFETHRDRLERLVVTGRTVTATGRFLGSNPQGVPIEFDWADVIELADNERSIRRLSHWHDRDLFRKLMAATAEQLGSAG